MLVIKRIHFWAGIAGILIFILTGQYMSLYHNHLQGMADGPRMLYRSAHIYLLLASIINLVVGIYLQSESIIRFRLLQFITSGMLLLSPALILAGFFIEPQLTELTRPYTRIALFALFAAAIFLTVIGLKNRKHP
ncbi:MAG: hypothetical protein PVG20_00055 [Thioalkalispiraceae bacterium]|jgi:hypothetical protein